MKASKFDIALGFCIGYAIAYWWPIIAGVCK